MQVKQRICMDSNLSLGAYDWAPCGSLAGQIQVSLFYVFGCSLARQLSRRRQQLAKICEISN